MSRRIEYQERKVIAQLVKAARNDFKPLIQSMPTRATTKRQRALEHEHGTPRQFAKSIVAAIPEISVTEARDAIEKYLKDWNKSE